LWQMLRENWKIVNDLFRMTIQSFNCDDYSINYSIAVTTEKSSKIINSYNCGYFSILNEKDFLFIENVRMG
jgi:hypothetical protein